MTPVRRGLLSALVFFCAAVGFAADAGNTVDEPLSPPELAQGYRDGRVLVKLRAGVPEEPDTQRRAAEDRSGVSRRRVFKHLDRQQILHFERTRSVRAVIKELSATGLYEFVEADRVVRALAVPNDPSFAGQWSLNNTGQSGGTSGAHIGAVAGWDVLANAPNVIVGVLDSGMRLTHTDLAANLWTNPSPSSAYAGTDLHGINATVSPATGNPNDDDDGGHGTHVSGIVGAVGNNSVGMAGVAWRVQLMPLKFLASTGTGSTSAELICIDYAIARGVHILNGSFGSNGFLNSEFAALQRARDAGIIVVVAAGNDGLGVEASAAYPAGYLLDNIVTVASTSRTDALAGSSNFSSGLVDLAAPGVDITSTINSSDTAYGTKSGTSMAAPHVSGALALLKARFPNDTYRQLINRLLRSATKLPSLTGKVQTGARLNLAAALNSTDSRPFNDDFSTRAELSGASIRVRSSNVGATGEGGEPSHASTTGGRSLWWTWTAPANANITFDTAGSSYDTLLAVYTGTALGSLTAVATNDNSAGNVTTSQVAFNVTAGTTYQIAVDGKNGASGAAVLKIASVPANDNFAAAQSVSGSSLSIESNTLNASTQPGELQHAEAGGGNSVWYRWTAPTSGRFQLAAVSPTIDMVAAVYSGSSLSTLTLLGSNDDSVSFNLDSLVSFNATSGQTYYFAIDNTESEGGDFILTLNDSVWQFPTGDAVTGSPAVAADGTVIFGSNDGFVYAVNPDGSEKWERATGGNIDGASPAIGPDGTVYIGSNDGRLHALDGTTGVRKWFFTATSGISSTPALATDGTIYFRDDTRLYALTGGTSSATQKWSFPLDGTGTYSSPAVATDGTVYVGTTDGAFHAVNPSGSQKWKFTADGDIYTSPAIASDGTVYFATLSGKVYALRPDGSQKWVWTMPDNSSVTSSPALGADGTLYFGGYDNKLHALGSDGVEKWAFAVGDEMRASSPAIASDGTIYFGNYDYLLYAVKSNGTLLRTYPTAQIIRSSPAIVNGRLYFGSNDFKLYAFPLSQNRLSSAWPSFQHDALHTARAPGGALITIGTQPQFQSATVGANVALSVSATGTGALSYQWLFNGAAITGATGSSHTIANAQTTHTGDYAVIVTDASGSLTSSTASVSVTVLGATIDARLFALSCRAFVGTGSNVLIPGIAVSGTGQRRVVVRAKGPALIANGVQGTLARPKLQLVPVSTGGIAFENTGWDTGGSANTAALIAAFNQIGLPQFDANSGDSALIADLDAGAAYTAIVSGVNGTTGVALVEVYELGGSNARMSAISCRALVGTGGDILIPGIAIAGTQNKQVIIRAAGPALTAQGVSGALAQLRLQLYDATGTKIAENIGWGTAANANQIFGITPTTGLVNFPNNSADCVILITLPPGGYTAQVSGVGGTTGVALIEVYEVP